MTRLCEEWSNLQEDSEICSTTLKRLAGEIQHSRNVVKQNYEDIVTAGDNLIEAVTDDDSMEEAQVETSINEVNRDTLIY